MNNERHPAIDVSEKMRKHAPPPGQGKFCEFAVRAGKVSVDTVSVKSPSGNVLSFGIGQVHFWPPALRKKLAEARLPVLLLAGTNKELQPDVEYYFLPVSAEEAGVLLKITTEQEADNG